jgi:type IV pilus assembly protein PilM
LGKIPSAKVRGTYAFFLNLTFPAKKLARSLYKFRFLPIIQSVKTTGRLFEENCRVFRAARPTVTHTRALGIDIGRFSVKALVVEETDEGVIVSRAASIRTPDGALDQGVVTDKQTVAAILRQVVKDFGLPLKSASLSTPMDQTLVRWVEMPRMDEDTLAAAAKFEAKKYLSYPVEQAEATIMPMDSDNAALLDEGKMRGLLVAAPSELISSRAETLELAGLEVDTMESEAMATLRALARQEEARGRFWRGQSLAFLLIGEETSGMIVSRDGEMTLNRALPWGARRLIESIAERNGLPLEEARELLAHHETYIGKDASLNWETPEATRQNNAVSKELRRLMNEIARISNYYSSLFPESSYDGMFHRMILCGGLAETRGLCEYLSHGLQLSVRVCRPFLPELWRLSGEAHSAIVGQESSMVVALGLALGKLEQMIHAAEGNPNREYVWHRHAA